MALWVGGVALDLPAWRNPGVIAGFLALLGVTVKWRGEENVPRGRHVLVSNHVSSGDLLMLFGRPQRYMHLITPLLPAPVFTTRNLPATLVPASKDTYEALAELAGHSGAAASMSSAEEDGGGGGAKSGGPAGSNGRLPAAAGQGLPPESQEAPVHLFPEGGMTNGRGMMAFSRGFARFALGGVTVVPAALRVETAFPQIRNHSLTSSFVANLFWFSWQPWTRIEVTAMEPTSLRPGEGRGAFVHRVQESIARELGVYVVPGFTVHHKRALASRKKGAAAGAGAGRSGGERRRGGKPKTLA